MKDLLNLLKNATPEERENLGRLLHTAQQLSVVHKRYEGAPKAGFYERLRATSLLNQFVEKLHDDLKQDENYKAIQSFAGFLRNAARHPTFRTWAQEYENKLTWNLLGARGAHPIDSDLAMMRSEFQKLIKDLTVIDIVNVADVLSEEGRYPGGVLFEIVLSSDKKKLMFEIHECARLDLYTFEQ